MQTCRHEILDRTLIWNQRRLIHALREFEQFYNGHGPHQGIANARPLHPLPTPITDPDQIARLDIRRRERLGGILHEYEHAACGLTSTDEVFGKGRVLALSTLETLRTRINLAFWAGQAGDPDGARDQYAALLPIREKVLGPEHPDTLRTRANLDGWAKQAGGGRRSGMK